MRVVNGRIDPPSYVDGWPTTLRGAEVEALLDTIRVLGAP